MLAPDLLRLAGSLGEFELFVAAVQAARLEEELLLAPAPRTVLAPINTAFGDAPTGERLPNVRRPLTRLKAPFARQLVA